LTTVYQTETEYSAHRGISQPRVSKMIRDGKLKGCIKKISGRKLIDRDLADAALEQNLDRYRNKSKSADKQPDERPNRKKKPTKEDRQRTIEAAELDPEQSLAESQRQKALYDAAIRKLDLDERSGEIIKKEDVEKQYFEIARRVRDSILNVPSRISAEISSMTDVHLVSEKMITELTSALEELSH